MTLISQQLKTNLIFLMGRPGSGKDTQSAMLAERLGMIIIRPGQIIRDSIDPTNPYHFELTESRHCADSGGMAPAEPIASIVLERIKEQLELGKICAANGFPRTIEHLPILDTWLNKYRSALSIREAFLYLTLPEDLALERIDHRQEKRSDDAESVKQQRHLIWQRFSEPITQTLAEQKRLTKIDGSGTPAEVYKKIIQELKI